MKKIITVISAAAVILLGAAVAPVGTGDVLFAIGAGGFALLTVLAPFVVVYKSLEPRGPTELPTAPVGSSTADVAQSVPYVVGPNR